jgi:cell shape-determining protein MreC
MARKQSTHAAPTSAGLAAVLCIAGLGLMFLPEDLASTIRSTVQDLGRPGQAVAIVATEAVVEVLHDLGKPRTTEHDLAALKAKLDAAETGNRALQAEHAALREQLAQAHLSQAFAPPTGASSPLFVPELVPARVVGAETLALWKGRKILAAGERDGVQQALLVLEGKRPVLDQGTEAQLAAGQPVYAGRVVAGRIATAGRWTSTLKLVTDREFSGAARLYRKTEQGWVAGPQGLLEGTGAPQCRVVWIEATEPVEVGDEVYTGENDGALPAPMYYGRVVRAELKAGATEWEIDVEPALAERRLQTVEVLRAALNPERKLAN